MVVNCEQVWQEISNYLEDDVEPNLRAAMEVHFRECDRCRAVLDGTRNVIQLYGDERMIDVPLGFSHRLQRRLEESIQSSRRSFMGWMVAAVAAVLVAGSFELSRSSVFGKPELRSEHAQPGTGVPPDMMVVVSSDGKLFHASGCPFIHDKAHVRTIVAREALKAGYAPCVRCMKKYLRADLNSADPLHDRRVYVDNDGTTDFLITSGWSGVHGYHSRRVFIISSGVKAN